MSKIVTGFLFAALFITLSSCDSSHTQDDVALPSVPISTLDAITVTPTTGSVFVGETQQFTAIGTYSDGTTLDITNAVFWAVSDETIATINDDGLAVGVSAGVINVTASTSRIDSNQAELTILPLPVLETIAITPTIVSIGIDETQQFTAEGIYSDGTSRDITTMVTWHSRNEFVATISNLDGSQGLATAIGSGTTRITATHDGIRSNAAELTVISPVILEKIIIDPIAPHIMVGETQKFTAKGVYSDGSSGDLTTIVTWESSDISVAKISNDDGTQGIATGMNPGVTKITATYLEVQSEPTELTVSMWFFK